MSTVQRNILVLVLLVILIGVAVYFVYPPGESTRLGLDLQGGLAVTLEAQDTPRAPRTEESMDQAINIMQERVDRLGVTEPEIQRQGDWKVSVQLPGVEDPEEALDIIGQTAVLEFYETQQFGEAYFSREEALEASGVETEDELPEGQSLIVWPADDPTQQDRWYVTDGGALMTGSALESADVGIDQANQPKVDMSFTVEGGDRFAEVTGELAQRGQVTGQDQLLAIVLDGVVQSAPRVQERITGGQAEITGRFTLEEAENLALVLQTGALPVELEILEERQVGATLGKASLGQALYAAGIGFILVLVFMVAYYRLLGVIADLALIVFGILFWGTLNAIDATLTLPGIAGAILTLGMAVDANIIIFARVREEVAMGKTVRTAVDSGFRKALRTILDANVTTLITAIILFWAATGGVRGFALTLGIGITLSMLTAIVLTRSLLYILAGWRPFRSSSLLGLPPRTTTERAA